jgi:RimJ/RimL family protein N-acetyltransferase
MLKGRIKKNESSKEPRITVRLTQPEDAGLIKEWLMYDNTLRGFPMADRSEVDDNMNMWMQYAKYGCGLSAELHGKFIGACILYINPYKRMNHQCLFAIVLDEKLRGQGYGTELIEQMERYAKNQLKIEQLHLEVYDGQKAHALYSRLGFIEYGREKDCLRDPSGESIDKILMYKWI